MRWTFSFPDSFWFIWGKPQELRTSREKLSQKLIDNIRSNLERYKIIFDVDTWFNDEYYCDYIYGQIIFILQQFYIVLQTPFWEWIISWTHDELKKHPMFVLWWVKTPDWSSLDKLLFDEITWSKSMLVNLILSLPIFKQLNELSNEGFNEWTKVIKLDVPYILTEEWEKVLMDFLSDSWSDVAAVRTLIINRQDNFMRILNSSPFHRYTDGGFSGII